MKRVVITGIGGVTPLASTFRESWCLLKAGTSGIRPLSLNKSIEGRINIKWKSAGQIHGLNTSSAFSRKEQNFIDPFVAYAVIAAVEAAESADILTVNSSSAEPEAIIVGSSRGGITTLEKELCRLQDKFRVSPFLMPTSTISAASAYIAAKLKITASTLGISNACASGANAIGEAFRMIRAGSHNMILAGGAEAPVCGICLEGYGSSQALSESTCDIASRPFDIARDGFVLSEGACILVLEEMDSALRRNASIIAEVVGYGNLCDASHLTLPSIRGEAMAIKAALKDAGISPDSVDYVNAHGTSTVAGDSAEAEAIKTVFDSRHLPVSSIKSMTGHMLGASGAFETACTAMSLKESLITPTVNTNNIDPACDINVVTRPMRCNMNIAISNSFGFGGVNAVLALRRYGNC
jgi:3-oxoacyl-[acyl-carrier-protein] synthase II